MKTFVIYKIENPQGSIYIGKTADFPERRRAHRSLAAKGKNKYVRDSVGKFGWDLHKMDIIEVVGADEKLANAKEIFWIRTFMSNRNKFPEQNGMNLVNGGVGCLGKAGSYKGQKRPDWVGRKISVGKKGTVVSDVHKHNLSVAHMGLPSPNRRPVLLVDGKGIVQKEFESVAEAVAKTGCSKSSILRVINNVYPEFKGKIFRYKET